MAMAVSAEQVLWLRLRGQRLQPRAAPDTSVAQVVADIGGVQAQDAKAATLALGVRSEGLVAADIERARVEQRSVVRTWCMRGTLHMVSSEDLGWLLALLGPGFVAGDARRRASLGLDEDTCARGIRILRDVLATHGPLTRAEIGAQLAGHDIKLVGQAAPHLISRAALERIVCYGPQRGTEPTYVLLEDWLGQVGALPRETALVELAHRYLKAYAPAGPEDLAAWSGLPLREARFAWQRLAEQLIAIESNGRPLWMLKTQAAALAASAPETPVVRLLPAFDTYLLGHRSRDLIVERLYASRINAGGGMLAPTLLVDGRVQGTWRSKARRNRTEVSVTPFAPLADAVRPGLEAEVARLGRFLGLATSLQVIIP